MSRRRATITTRCPANQYAGPTDIIAEFSFPNGCGGLIALRNREKGPRIDIYRTDDGLMIVTPTHHETTGEDHAPDRATLDRIADLMSAREWNADTADAIAELIRASGRTIEDLEE